ncbi:8-amino-7-oxononanoate synthase [Sarracenia purpurea var. burkii]
MPPSDAGAAIFAAHALLSHSAHGTFVCGKNGGGVTEQFNCESDVDICVGTLSKVAGCHSGFIACR